MTKLRDKGFSTRSVHAGERINRVTLNPVVTPIYPSVGYIHADPKDLDAVLGGEKEGFVYSTRYGNPTVAAFEEAVAVLEGAEQGHAFASGMAAIHMALLVAGAREGTSIVAAADIYGATYTLFSEHFSNMGVGIHFVDILALDNVNEVVELVKPVAVFVETVSNPLLKVANLPALAEIAHSTGALLLVDNTFCSPYLCNPIQHGADIVIHSATKYLSGHGDVSGGVVLLNSSLRDKSLSLTKIIGGSLGPFEAWLALRGLKTLSLRMRRQCDNALTIATWLKAHPKIDAVYYPFLPDHPQYDLMNLLSGRKGAGGVVSFEISRAGKGEVFAFMQALELIQPATSLGDIYSLLLYPAISSHRGLSADERAALGIGNNLVRLSAGIEDVNDIQADLANALAIL